MIKDGKYSIPIYENGILTEWTVDGIVGDDKYYEIIKFGDKEKLPDFININTINEKINQV